MLAAVKAIVVGVLLGAHGPTGDLTPAFYSDWSTELGTSDNATTDGDKWEFGPGGPLEVVPSTGLNFPSANCLAVTIDSEPDVGQLQDRDTPFQAIGTTRVYRFNTRVSIGDDVAVNDTETHPHQEGAAAGSYNFALHVYHDVPPGQGAAGDGKWMPQFRVNASINGFTNSRWGGDSGQPLLGPWLDKNVTYRIEIAIARLDSTTFNMHVRIFNSSGALLYDDEDFLNQNS